MAFVPNCGAIIASHRRRMRELDEEGKEQQLLLFDKGVNFKMNNVDFKIDTFVVEDKWDLGDNIIKKINTGYIGSYYQKRKILDFQIVPYKVEYGRIKEWKVFVKYIEE